MPVPDAHNPDAEARRAREVRESLAAAERDSGTFAQSALAKSSLAASARRTVDHFRAADALAPGVPADPIEVWGRRIGRALSLAGVIGLSIYLYLTYIR